MPLPFGLKLKRTRRYTVSSKSCLVARIQLLNNEFVEFTLSVESTGQESLEAVAQRLELREVTYFSLWYYNKQNQRRWVDLEKPLKKQLDKYALEPTVYFGVVFYVPSVLQLQQEITRYQYYLQLKKDILEGNIPCTLEQAIQLAGLAVQADFGDFDQYESQDFLQKFALFPVGWLQDEKVLEEATQKVALLHQKYRGLTAPDAEMLYMQEVERMDGYGEESYPAKDSQGSDIAIGACLEGIFVKHKNGRPPVIFRWQDIANMSHNKSFFALELANKEETIQFQTEDMETAKYVWRLCVARHKFYRLNQCNLQTQTITVNPIRRRSSSRLSLPKPQPYVMPPPPQLHYNGHYTEPYASSQDNLFVPNQNGYYCHSQTSLDRAQIDLNGRIRNGSVYSAHSTSSLNNPQAYLQPSPMSSNPSISGSDVMRPDYIPTHRHSALIPPSYRPTPDYETVMKQLNRGLVHAERQSHSLRNLNIGNSYAYSRPDALVYSQPEIREHAHFASPQSAHYPFNLNYSFHSQSPYPYPAERRPVVGAVSVPELTNVQLQAQDYPAPNIMKTQVYRPPPPYPYPRPANSTPDLSRHLYISSSNPDLITRRVHHSVQTFQEDSLPVAHSLQEVSEPLTAARHAQLQKRNSIEIAGLTHGLEGPRQPAAYAHEPLPGCPCAAGTPLPGPLHIHEPKPHGAEAEQRAREGGHVHATVEARRPRRDGLLTPSMSESDLTTSGRYRARRDSLKKRPVSDLLSGKKNTVQGLPPLGVSRLRAEGEPGPAPALHICHVAPAYDVSWLLKLAVIGVFILQKLVSVSGIEWDYIATQGPLQNTCQDFWQMVWEQGIAIIAMVTAEEEGGREKSFRYWPRLGSRHNTVTYGRFKITTRFRTDSGCYATTGLKMKHLLTGQERTVWHLQYTDWPEHGCPEDLKGFLSYLEEIQSVRRHTNSTSEPKSPNPPLLVHCSAGVGRTGVVILSEIMIACLEHNEVLDIPRVLDMLRQQRMMLVQTLCQYTFVYRVLIQFLKSSRLI
ncbi:tyrosine-protein phosphatase non-receptor type 21 [Marmota marmota marmota]|uniref:tyrosine-protein phosphatase non-receptor type 21 n=1 Tax=Marmota marmota marmota TaxID=9994 RepID=UPI002093B342|nr:tyrosine-protein phosphatase non-receptor type 21 [Marmota marmota marmota]